MADKDYDKIIRRAVIAATATGPLVLTSVPGSDLLPLIGIWGTMIGAIASRTGHRIPADDAKKIALAVCAGGFAMYSNMKKFNGIIAKFPGMGRVIGAGSNSAMNAWFTAWLGLLFVDLFEKEGADVTDIDYDVSFVESAMSPGMHGGLLTRLLAFGKRWMKDPTSANASRYNSSCADPDFARDAT